MKKILIFLTLFLSICFFSIENSFANCTYNEGSSVLENTENCFSTNSSVVKVENDVKIEGGFKEKISKWIDNLALVLGIFAVGAIVYGGLSMTLSTGDDEKIKKSKDIIKWSVLGFIGIVMATTIATLVINVMFDIGGNTVS